MNTHVMLDLETLSTAPNAVVVQAGVCIFNREEIIGATGWYLDVNEQIKSGRHIKAETLVWWFQQPKEVRDLLEMSITKGISQKAFCEVFASYIAIQAPKASRLWGNGSDFDIAILSSLYIETGVNPFWNYGDVRCMKTMRRVHNIAYTDMHEGGVKHNGTDDAINQARTMQLFFREHPEFDR